MKLCVGLLVSFAALTAQVSCEVFSQCDGQPERSFVYSRSCQSFIYCNGEDSFESSCPNGMAFNAAERTCDNPDNVVCNEDMFNVNRPIESLPVKVTPPRQITKLPPIRNTERDRPGPPSLVDRPIVTSRPIPDQPPIASGTSFVPSGSSAAGPTERPIIPAWPDEPVRATISQPTPPEFSKPQGRPFATTTLAPITTTAGLVLPTPNGPLDIREQCLRKSNGYFVYPGNCRFYYRCVSGFLTKEQCPTGFGWDIIKRTCTPTGCLSQIDYA